MKNSCIGLFSKVAMIAFVVTSLGMAYGQSYDIVTVNVKTGIVSRVTKIDDAGEFNADWSPDGKKIAHDVVGGPAYWYGQSIFITNIETGESYPLIGGEGGNDASWSPDGKTIAFDLYWYYLVLVPSQGGTPRYIRYDAISPSWSPNSKRLVFRQQSDGSIRTLDVATGNETFIAYGSQPDWSPNGQYIAYETAGGIWKVKVSIDGIPLETPKRVTSSGGMPSWSASSSFVVFHDWPNGEPDIYMVSADGGTPVRLSGRPGGFETGDYDPSFSSNGQFVAYSSFYDPLIFQPQVQAVAREHVTMIQNFPNPFSESTTISFSLPEREMVKVLIYDLQGRVVNTLAEREFESGVHELRWSGDDSMGRRMDSGIYVCQLQTGFSIQSKKMNLTR